MRVLLVARSDPWASRSAVSELARRAWAELGHGTESVEFCPTPRPAGWSTRPDGSALRLRLTLGPGPAADLVWPGGDGDLMVGLTEALEFRDGGGSWLSQLAARAATAVVPLIVLAERVALSERESRQLGVEAAYAVDPTDPDSFRRVARTWSW
ncbi:MAG: hypothetical protein LBJ44_10975 [Propionibacteriaceae bacterium]|jgi:hypothetical protein|nr:hypothetical protein [Propionibacteriaceae bacterium]